MLTKKSKYLSWLIFLLVGMGYVSAMSNIEIHYFLKSLIIFLPIQLVTLVYVTAKIWGVRDWGLRIGMRRRGDNREKADKGTEEAEKPYPMLID